MKLVSIRKLILLLLLISGRSFTQAQEVWTLRQCLDSGLAYNKTLQINRNNIAIGTQREKEAEANLIPKVSINADYKYFFELPTQLMPQNALNPAVPEGQFRSLQFGVPHNLNANVQLAVPLYNPQIYGAIQSAGIATELSQLQYQKAEEQVVYDITTLYYNAQIALNRLAFLDSNMTNTGKLLKLTELLKEQLMAKGSDVSKVKLQSEQLAVQRETVRNKYEQILNLLKLNIGLPPEKELSVTSDVSFRAGQQYVARVNTDISILRKQNDLLNTELNTLNNSQYLPALNLTAMYGTTGFGYDKTPNDFLKFFSNGFAGIQFSWPVFNGTVTQRKINQKKLEKLNNEHLRQLTSDRQKIETENAEKQRETARKTIENVKMQIDLAATIYRETLLQQKQGTAGLTDVLSADNALRESQQNYLNIMIDYLKADLELKRLTGTLKSEN
ncbi:hypothetical protein MASR2M18_01210 [Ignavibacteria bacterium]|nr:TolC family protein [Bacteroidota bacterium]MCZ2132150.1 TolC family protein [Bacteroidota bacterium]